MAKKNNTYDVPTTNFTIDLDKIEKSYLNNNYQLFSFCIPDKFRHIKNGKKYSKLHNEYKNQLEYPYYFYMGKYMKIFTLVPIIDNTPSSICFDFLDNHEVFPQEESIISYCTSKDVHILGKLLLSSWFYKKHRTCQSNYFYIHSKGTSKKAEVLSINLKCKNKEFIIDNSARRLIKLDRKTINPQHINSDSYYERLNGEIYYRQVKTEYVKKWLENKKDEKDLWKVEVGASKGLFYKRPSIKWFEDYQNIHRCKSYLLLNFQNELVDYFNSILGENVAIRQIHRMTKVKVSKKINGIDNSMLNISLLQQVGVLDNRLKGEVWSNKKSIQDYVVFFNENYNLKYNIKFVPITHEELNRSDQPILVIQDVNKQLFEEDNFLYGYDDPKKKLYMNYAKKIPLQTLNINTNSIDLSQEKYFEYDLMKLDKNFEYKIDVCLSELLLKTFIINKRAIYNENKQVETFPHLIDNPNLRNYAFMHNSFFMYVSKNNVLEFIDLRKKEGREKRNLFLQEWNIDWFKMKKALCTKHHIYPENLTEKIKEMKFVFSDSLVFFIEDTKEQVLHKYDIKKDGKSQRAGENKTALEGIFYSKEKEIYTVGAKSMRMTLDDSVRVRKLNFLMKKDAFDPVEILKTLAVEFVRNKQYTVYPYFFDLLNLYRSDILQSE